MQYDVETVGEYSKKVSVTVPAGDVEAAFKQVFTKLRQKARIPGFRPGKVPLGMIEKQYGDAASAEVQEQLVEQTLTQAVSESQLEIVAPPKVDSKMPAKGSDFSFTAEFEVRPTIELAKTKGLEAPKVDIEIEDKLIDAELEGMRAKNAQMVPVMVRDVVEEGDFALVDYKGTIDGVPFQGGTGENALVEMGGGDYIPGFAEGIVGAKVPSDRVVPVTFPEDYQATELAGKEAEFAISVKEIKTKELPALDDDFAQDVGEENLEALRTKIREQLETQKKQQAEGEQREALLKQLVEANPFGCPPSLIEAQAKRNVQNAAQRFQQMMGQQFNLEEMGMEEIFKNARPQAEFEVRSSFLMNEIAVAEKIEVDDSDLQAEVDRFAQLEGAEEEAFRAMLQDEKMRRGLQVKLTEDKVVAFLLEHAVLVDPPSDEGDDAEQS